MAGSGPHAPRTGRERALPGLPRVAALLAPPLALMGLVWFLSAQHHLSTDLGTIDLVLRKAAHMTEFGLLALLWIRAISGLRRGAEERHPLAPPVLAGAAIALGWAIVDELHQTTVDGRVGTPTDVLIDATGIALAVGLRGWVRARRRGRTVTGDGTPHRTTPDDAAPGG